MRTTASISTLAALGLLALSTPAAHAKPASIKKVSQTANAVSVKITNPNRYKVRGSVSLVSGQQLVAKRKAAIRSRRSATVNLKLPSGAPRTLTVVTRLGRKGAKPSVIRKSVKLATPGKGDTSRPGTVQAPAPSQAGNLWTATAGGAPFALRVENGTISLAEPIDMAVICNSTGEYSGTAQSFEHFDETDGWAIGNQDGIRQRDTTRLNVLVDSTVRRVSYKLASTRSGDTITGTLSQSFFHSRYNPFTNGISYVNCAGTAEFTAHPNS